MDKAPEAMPKRRDGGAAARASTRAEYSFLNVRSRSKAYRSLRRGASGVGSTLLIVTR